MSEQGFQVDRDKPGRFSMSLLKDANDCLRMAVHNREASLGSIPATVGIAFHEIAADVGKNTVEALGEPKPDVWEALDRARAILREPERYAPLPKDAWEDVLDLVAKWANTVTFSPNSKFEVPSQQPIDGITHSARIDVLTPEDDLVVIDDWKTGRGLPKADQVSFQGEVYAWHCSKLFPESERFRFQEHFVRLGISIEPVEFTRADLEQTEEWLSDQAARLENAFEKQDFPPTPGGHCSYCPVTTSCPLPSWARPVSEIKTDEDAIAQFEALLVEQESVNARKKTLRAFIEATEHPPIVASGKQIGFSLQRRKSLDKKAAESAGIDLEAFKVEKETTVFSITKDKGDEAV